MNHDEKRFLEQIQQENHDAHAETRRQVETTAAELRQEFQTAAARFEQLNAETRQEFQDTSAKIRRHFDTVAEDIAEKTHREIQLLAESLAHVDHKVDVNSAKIDRLAADNEVFRAAFANVDRRLRVVEDIVLPQKPS
jgi:TRAP-type C4-dicarboxylate transport system substrate-binding protein